MPSIAKIAVISDLHIGDAARDNGLKPSSTISSEDVDYIKDFKSLVESQGVTADYLLIPGDLTNEAKPDEFERSSEIILSIASALGVEQECIYIVPGNHDLNWEVAGLSGGEDFWKTLVYRPMISERSIFKDRMASDDISVIEKPYFTVWESDDLVVLGINSAAYDMPDVTPHRGEIKQDTLEAINNKLDQVDGLHDKIKIALFHHHPLQYSDPAGENADFSILLNANNLLSSLTRYNFDFIIHGHKHVPKFIVHSIDMGTPLATLCAGSFSVKLPPDYNGHVNNQFHIIDIEGRSVDTGNVFGKVESWAYLTSHRWMKSRKHNGIEHWCPFGWYANRAELSNNLSEIITESLSKRDYAEWSFLRGFIKYLNYLPADLVYACLDDISSDLGIRVIGENLSELTILKVEPKGDE